jgi:hypothetical protein
MTTRSPRTATHVLSHGISEMFYSRRGHQVFEFSMSRGQWFPTLYKPHHLTRCRPLNIFELHPETAREMLARRRGQTHAA